MADHGPFNAVLALHSNAPANELARLLDAGGLLVLTAPRERWARQQLVDLVEALRLRVTAPQLLWTAARISGMPLAGGRAEFAGRAQRTRDCRKDGLSRFRAPSG